LKLYWKEAPKTGLNDYIKNFNHVFKATVAPSWVLRKVVWLDIPLK
jgi:hypothetical protein